MANLQLIKEFADKKNITLAQIANELGITPQALSKIMRNNSTKIETLERIADILKVSVTLFFDKPENKGVKQVSHGDCSPNTIGDGNVLKIEAPKIVDRLLLEIAEQRKASQEQITESQKQISVSQEQISKSQEQLSKSQEQIDRLLALIERMK